jgi:hypothetical protein
MCVPIDRWREGYAFFYPLTKKEKKTVLSIDCRAPPFVGSIHHRKARNINQIRYEGSKKKLIIEILFQYTHKQNWWKMK